MPRGLYYDKRQVVFERNRVACSATFLIERRRANVDCLSYEDLRL